MRALIDRDPAAPAPGDGRLAVLGLVALSLAVRLPLLAWWSSRGVRPLFDEKSYFDRALAFGRIVRTLARGQTPPAHALGAAYGGGVWPPLNGLVLSLANLSPGSKLAAARAVTVLVSVATTAVIFYLGRRIAGRGAAIAGALLHAIYPSFLLFACLLYSETLFVFLLAVTLLVLLRFQEVDSPARGLALAAAAGVTAGLAILTRTSGLALIAALAAAFLVLGKRPRRSTAAVAVALAATAVTLTPWMIWLARREHRFVPLSTHAGYYFFYGNEPLDERRPGGSQREADRILARLSKSEHVDVETAARREVLDDLRAEPAAFLKRSLVRGRSLFGPDVYLLRHLLAAVSPPVGQRSAAVAAAVAVLAPALLVALAARGLVTLERFDRRQTTVALFAAAVALPPIVTISNSRMGLPVLALLLPWAGAGLRRSLPVPGRALRRTAWLLAGGLALVNVATVSAASRDTLEASSWYGHLSFRLGRAIGLETSTVDCVALVADRTNAGRTLNVRPLDPRYRIRGWSRGFPWRVRRRGGSVRFLVEAKEPAPPLELVLDGSRGAIRWTPIRPATWKRWQPTDDPRIRSRWCGSGEPVRTVATPSENRPFRRRGFRHGGERG